MPGNIERRNVGCPTILRQPAKATNARFAGGNGCPRGLKPEGLRAAVCYGPTVEMSSDRRLTGERTGALFAVFELLELALEGGDGLVDGLLEGVAHFGGYEVG